MKNLNSSQKIIFLKILRNILNILIFLWVGVFLTEILIPGFISNYLSFSKIILFISIIILGLHLLSKSFNLNNKALQKNNKKNPPLWIIGTTLLVSVIASINFHPLIILAISILSGAIIFYLSKIIFEE